LKRLIILLLGLVLLITTGICSAVSADTATVIKVGVCENKPKIFTDDTGKVSGFWADIIEYLALKEGWQIEYVHGIWNDLLVMLEKNEIDILPSTAYTQERGEKYAFNKETVYVSWSVVYTRPGTDIKNILDLQEKKIAVMKGSLGVEGPEGIKALTRSFSINCTFLYFNNFLEVLDSLDKNEADAGVVSNDFWYSNEKNYNIVRTAIFFQPTRLYFAFPKNSTLNQYLIEKIDNDLVQLKKDENSIYNQALNKWFFFEPIEKQVIPTWVMWVLITIGVIAVLSGGGTLLLRLQVKRRTKELAEYIAKLEKIEKDLRESEERLHLILETVPLGLVLTNTEGQILQANQSAIKLSGYNETELKDRKYRQLFTESDRPRVIASLTKTLHNGYIDTYEYTMQRKNGSEFPAEMCRSLVKDENDNLIGTVAVFENITRRRQAEEEHRKVIEYRELDSLKTNLLSTVSHELRTPLASIKGYSSLLLMYDRKLEKAQKRESLEAIDRSTDRLTELIGHLLDMSRLNAGMLRLNMASVKPSTILLAAVTEARLRAPKYKFNEKIKRQLPALTADSGRLRQVIDNLLDNAIKYSPEGTEITVCSEIKGEELLVSVADHGRGISAQEVDKIFDRFYRIEQRLAKDPGGMGLGLSLCKALVKAHGGKIWAESEVGKGSTFYFTIPVKKEKPDASKK
jgi:two-component system cell cycle sensor histidine kinase/response regulator CckA